MAHKILKEKRKRSLKSDLRSQSRKPLQTGRDLSLEEILNQPIRDLNLTLKGSLLEECIEAFHEELDRFKIKMRPRFYLSDGYGTCEGTANIGLAFWDADETLKKIAQRFIGEYNTREDLMMLLRHEMGHAFSYSYKLYRQEAFRKLFKVKGHFFNTYPMHDRYRRNPWSPDFVNPCGDCYAQKHPDDDFAETFATLMNPEIKWRNEYQHKIGALSKLLYVEFLIKQWGQLPVIVKNDTRKIYDPVEDLDITVRKFFAAKRAQKN